MAAGTISIKQKSDTTISFHFTNDGADVDLTGKVVYLTVKKSPSQTTPDIAKTIASHTDAAHGKTSTVITHTDSNVTARGYRYDIQIVDVGGSVTASDVGEFVVLPTVR